MNTNCFAEASFNVIKGKYLGRKKINRLDVLLENLQLFTNDIFLKIEKSLVVSNKEFLSYRMMKLNDEHREAIRQKDTGNVSINKISKTEYLVDNNKVTKYLDNPYSISMFCKGCCSYVSDYVCDCRKFCVEKIYCFYIHLILFNSGEVPKSGAKIIKKVDNKNLLCLTEEKEKLTEKKMGKVHKSIENISKKLGKLEKIALHMRMVICYSSWKTS